MLCILNVASSDWEAVVPCLLTKPPAFSLPLPKESSTSVEKDSPKQKQRGRGAFTYGGGGLYSDGVDRSSSLEGCEVADWNDTDGASEHCMYLLPCQTLEFFSYSTLQT